MRVFYRQADRRIAVRTSPHGVLATRCVIPGCKIAIATRLDEEMLAQRPAIVYPSHTPFSAMPARPGQDIAVELGGRYLLRYLIRKQYRQFKTGSTSLQFVTSTPYRQPK